MKQTGGKLIVFEGIDGAGKTTQIRMLTERLRQEGYEVCVTAEPTDRPEGKLLRAALSGEYRATPEELAALFTADRIAHNTDPENGLNRLAEDGKIILCDRYYYSTLAYQGAVCGMDWVAGMNLGCPSIRKPDLCVFLDLTPEESMERIRKRCTDLEIYETREQLERIRDSFRSVFDRLCASDTNERIAVVRAAGTPEEVSERIVQAVRQIL